MAKYKKEMEVFLSFDGDEMKGVEVWDTKPQWRTPLDKEPYFTTLLKPSSIYMALHGKDTFGLKKGEYRSAIMTVGISKKETKKAG